MPGICQQRLQEKKAIGEECSRARNSQQQRGGVALEYVLVTTFAAIVGVSLLGVAAKVFKSKIEAIAAEADMDLDEIKWNPFAEGS